MIVENKMEKEKFIELLKKHSDAAGVFRGRFVRYGSGEDYWSYVRPAIDCFEPTIDLSKPGVVRYISYSEQQEYSYEEFAKKYFLA